jgi:flagellar biosynthesis chaperone FliJ
MPQNEQREFIVSEGEHDCVNRLGKVLLSEEFEEMKTSLETLMQYFTGSEQQAQSNGDLGLDAQSCF